MKQPPINFWCIILLAVGLIRCDHQLHYRQVSFSVQRHFLSLPAWQAPRKVEVDDQHRKIYWLNRSGEINSINADGSEETLINKGIGAQLGITYIEDFAIDSEGDALYFTDLMDVSTGLSALKKSDLAGNDITTIETFAAETPYAVCWNAEQQGLYYATKLNNTKNYSLHLLGETIPLITADRKIDSISSYITDISNQPVLTQPLAERSSLSF